jgi:hypothetical protein
MPGVDYLLPQDEVVTRRLPVTQTAKGTHIVHGKRIFRAGTFKDSKGVLHTWTIEQLDAVVANFNHLRGQNLLAGVPVRVDHTFSARDVVGWVSDLKRDGEFLVADLHLTESAAFSKWDSGTYEPVSSELAPYETNGGDIYYPTLIGVAFVDIPAVEGLYRASGVNNERVTAVFVKPSMLDSKTARVYESGQEDHMPTIASAKNSPFSPELANMSTAELAELASNHSNPATEADQEVATEAEEAAPVEEANDQAPVEEASGTPEASAVIEEAPAEASEAPAEAEGAGDDAGEGAAEAAPIPLTEPKPGAVHSAAQPSVMTFRVGGVEITDPALVQAHIDSLEQFQSQAIHGQRKEFVTGLVRENKILAGQAEALTELALSMDASQYEKFVASYEVAGANPLMAAHGRSSEASTPVTGGKSLEQLRDELTVHSAIIERHKLAGKPQEWIEQTASFRRYTELNTQLNG